MVEFGQCLRGTPAVYVIQERFQGSRSSFHAGTLTISMRDIMSDRSQCSRPSGRNSDLVHAAVGEGPATPTLHRGDAGPEWLRCLTPGPCTGSGWWTIRRF